MLTATVPAGTVINRELIISKGHKYDRRKLQIFVIHRVNYFSGSTTPRLNGWFLRTSKQVTLSYSQLYKWPLITFSFSWNVKFNKLKCLGIPIQVLLSNSSETARTIWENFQISLARHLVTGNRVTELYLHILLSVSVDLQFPLWALASITKKMWRRQRLECTEM